jgi:hypothetical protein
MFSHPSKLTEGNFQASAGGHELLLLLLVLVVLVVLLVLVPLVQCYYGATTAAT